MAIAVNETGFATGTDTLRVDIRELAAAAAFCRKARPRASAGRSAWHDNVLVRGGYVYGGDPYDTIVSVYLDGTQAHRAFTVPYDTIIAAAKGTKGTVELKSGGSIVRDDGAIFSWKAEDSVTYDMFSHCYHPMPDVDCQYSYGGDTFRNAVAMVTPTASKDDSRPVLTGVFLASDGEWAATDSYRLIIASVPSECAKDSGGDGTIVPASVLRLAATVKKAASFTVTIGGAVPRVEVRMISEQDRIMSTVTSRIVEGQYPKCANLVPTGFAATVDCDGDLLRNALKAAVSMVRRNAPITFTLDDSTSTLLVSAGSGDTCGEWYVPCLYDTGATDGKLAIGVNAEFAADGANAIGGEHLGDVSISVVSGLRPLLMTATHDAGFNPRYVLMPIRI